MVRTQELAVLGYANTNFKHYWIVQNVLQTMRIVCFKFYVYVNNTTLVLMFITFVFPKYKCKIATSVPQKNKEKAESFTYIKNCKISN